MNATTTQKNKTQVTINLIIVFFTAVAANILVLSGYFANKDDFALFWIFAAVAEVVAILSLVISLIKYQDEVVWWMWLMAILLTVLPLIEMIILSAFR